jgi:hypothetical protein
MNEVTLNEVVLNGGGSRVLWLVLVQAAVDVFLAAAGIVGAPAVAVTDARVRGLVDVVVGNGGKLGVRHEDGNTRGEEQAVVEEDVAREVDAGVCHARVRRVVGVGEDAARSDAVAHDVGEVAVEDRDIARTQPDAGAVRVAIVADAHATCAESDKVAVGHGDLVGGADLHGAGHLVPFRPRRLKLGIRHVLADVAPGLLVDIT